MSNSILEAMATGLPIITTDTGGSKELIKDNGFIVEKASSEELRKAIENYLKNTKLIKIHETKSRSQAKSMSWDKVAKEYFKEYD